MADLLFGGSDDRLNFAFGDTQVKTIAIGETEVWSRSYDVVINVNALENATLTTPFPTQSGVPGSSFSADIVFTADSAYKWDGSAALSVDSGDAIPAGWSISSVVGPDFGDTVTITISGTIPDSDFETTVDVTGLTLSSAYNIDFLICAAGGPGVSSSNSNKVGNGGGGGVRTSYPSIPNPGGKELDSALTVNQNSIYTITVGPAGDEIAGSGNGPQYTAGNSSIVNTSESVNIVATGGYYANRSTNSSQPSGSSAGDNGYPAQNSDGSRGGGAGSTTGNPVASQITGVTDHYGEGGGDTDVSPSATDWGHGGNQSSTQKNGSESAQGVVILRIPTANYSGTYTGTVSVSTDDDDTILQFTGSGTYTA